MSTLKFKEKSKYSGKMTANKSSSLLCQDGLSPAQSSSEVRFKATALPEFLPCQNDAIQSLSQEEKIFQVPEETEHCYLTHCRMHFSSEDFLSPNAYIKETFYGILRSAGTQVFFTQYTTNYNLFCMGFLFSSVTHMIGE